MNIGICSSCGIALSTGDSPNSWMCRSCAMRMQAEQTKYIETPIQQEGRLTTFNATYPGNFSAEQVHELVMVAIKERDKLWVTAVTAEPDTHLWQRILQRFNDARPNPDPALQPLKII